MDKTDKIENEKKDAYREYKLRKLEKLSVSKNINPWFELFNYRFKRNENPLTGKKIKMAKKLKSFASFGNKRYDRGSKYFSTKAEIIKEANKQKKMGKNVVRDKNSKGHFLWINAGTKSKKHSNKKITKLEADWSNTDKLINSIKVGKKIDYQDFDEKGFQKYFEGTISKVDKEKNHIFVKHKNKEVSVNFAFYEKENEKVKLTFSSARVSGHNRSFMGMIRKSDKGKGAFNK